MTKHALSAENYIAVQYDLMRRMATVQLLEEAQRGGLSLPQLIATLRTDLKEVVIDTAILVGQDDHRVKLAAEYLRRSADNDEPLYTRDQIDALPDLVEFVEAVARGSYPDSDPASLLESLQKRASQLILLTKGQEDE